MRVRVAAMLVVFAHSCSDDEAATTGAPSASAQSSSAASGTGGSGGASEPCFDYASFTPAPAVSFEDDVMPVLAQHCNSATCHGSTTAPDGKLYLGRTSMNDETTLDTVHGNLVGVAATRAPLMMRVVAGDAEHSFLMIKLDGDFACPQVTCGMLGCGVKMPHGSSKPKLDIAVRNTIRSWIQNGAPRDANTGTGGAAGMGGMGGAGG